MPSYRERTRVNRAFPRFPTEIDIVVEVVEKNIDKIRLSCDKGRARFNRRKSRSPIYVITTNKVYSVFIRYHDLLLYLFQGPYSPTIPNFIVSVILGLESNETSDWPNHWYSQSEIVLLFELETTSDKD